MEDGNTKIAHFWAWHEVWFFTILRWLACSCLLRNRRVVWFFHLFCARPPTREQGHRCSLRTCRLALLVLVILILVTSCLASPVVVAILALAYWFGHDVKECPFKMHDALCNWPRLYGGSSGPLPELEISEGNMLWVDPNVSAAREAMSQAAQELRQAHPKKFEKDLCNFIESWLPRLGLNGLIDLLQGLQLVREGAGEDATAWGIELHDLNEDLVDMSENWKHDLGAYMIARLNLHPVARLGRQHEFNAFLKRAVH